MLTVLLLTLSLQGQASNPAPASDASATSAPVAETSQAIAIEVAPEELTAQLPKIKRIFIDDFGDDPTSKQVQEMIVASLLATKRFIVTENRATADAVLKGKALEKTSQEFHAYGESTAVSAAAGGHSGSVSGSYTGVPGYSRGSIHGSSSGGFAARGAAIEDSSAHTETIDHARIAIRLVSRDGDVLWATTQESKGAKYKGASADVADKAVKQLLRDIEKEQKKLDAAQSKAPTQSTTPAK